ncbi:MULTISPECIES: hypothetical protein [Halomonadaceae]|uniref:hypothetical protein n=1 Tax=Halomonadaceae TaxID=28256 RepID=UPI00159AD9B2|nr:MULTISPECIES: hypothetical protein [Halomonas]QJQ95809.1 hypothetical protein HIO72_11365 [Halomonas sp. PA5]
MLSFSRHIARWLCLLLPMLFPPLVLADPLASPQPFSARYHLMISGWPNASIEHDLTRQGEHWQSHMKAAIAVARGSETSRFRVNADETRALTYHSGYSLLGIGGNYRLGHEMLGELPDRQTALFALSRQAIGGECSGSRAAPCEMRYVDHRGREETLHYRILTRGEVSLPAGDFEAVSIESWNPDKPDRQLYFSFHPELPGLLLSVDYYRDGERRSRLMLTELAHTSS